MNKMNSLYHHYMPDSVAGIVTLIEYNCAIYRGHDTNILWHISWNALNEYDINRGQPVYNRFVLLNSISTSKI